MATIATINLPAQIDSGKSYPHGIGNVGQRLRQSGGPLAEPMAQGLENLQAYCDLLMKQFRNICADSQS